MWTRANLGLNILSNVTRYMAIPICGQTGDLSLMISRMREYPHSVAFIC